MPFRKGDKNINRQGRPRGKEVVDIPVRTQKALIKILTERALNQHDFAAQESLALLIFSQNQETPSNGL